MSRTLPPLNALKAFEAAARHESLKKAAAELNVAQAGISRHIRELETRMRVILFERTGHGVRLTGDGKKLAVSLTEAFDLMACATAPFARTPKRRQRLTITSDVPFATHWLVPRFGRLTSVLPKIDIVIDPTNRLVDFTKEDADLGIRWGVGPWRNTNAEQLTEAELTLVCSPALLKRTGVKSPHDLPGDLLLREDDRALWSQWLTAAGVGDLIQPSGPTLLADLTMTAAEGGQGFALVDAVVASNLLISGRLVRPFGTAISPYAYFLVSAPGRPLSSAGTAFRNWLKAELEQTLRATASLSRKTGRGKTRKSKT